MPMTHQDLPTDPSPEDTAVSGRIGFWQRLSLTRQAGSLCLISLSVIAVGLLIWWQLNVDNQTLRYVIWVAVLVGVLLSGGMIWFVSRLAQRLDRLAREAAMIRRAEGNTERKLSLEPISHEWLRAVRSISSLIDRMRLRQKALQSQNAELSQRLDHSTHTISALQDLSINLGSQSDIRTLIEQALDALEQTLTYTTASVWGRDMEQLGHPVVLLGYRSVEASDDDQEAKSLVGLRLSRLNLDRYEQIERQRQPVIENRVQQNFFSWLWEKVIDDARTSTLYRSTRSWMAVPLCSGENVVGVLRIDHDEFDYFDTARSRLLIAVGSQTALAIRHAQMLTQEREVAVQAERTRIARDLHDAVSQTLFAANVIAGTLSHQVQRATHPESAEWARQAKTLEKLNQGALSEMRLLMYELRPTALDTTPMAELLMHALTALSCRSEIQVEHHLSADGNVPAPVKIELYRIAQEALSNIARHSQAKKVFVQWDAAHRHDAVLRIVDDGIGFEPEQNKPGHFGLENMKTRALLIGARLTLASAPGMGTELRVQLGAPTTTD